MRRKDWPIYYDVHTVAAFEGSTAVTVRAQHTLGVPAETLKTLTDIASVTVNRVFDDPHNLPQVEVTIRPGPLPEDYQVVTPPGNPGEVGRSVVKFPVSEIEHVVMAPTDGAAIVVAMAAAGAIATQSMIDAGIFDPEAITDLTGSAQVKARLEAIMICDALTAHAMSQSAE